MEKKTTWKKKPLKEGLQINNTKHKLKKIKMKKDMNFANIESFIDILDDIPDNTKEGFAYGITTTQPDPDEDYDGVDNVKNKKTGDNNANRLYELIRYLSFLFSFAFISIRFFIYSIAEGIYDILSPDNNNDSSESDKKSTISMDYWNKAWTTLQEEQKSNKKDKTHAVDINLETVGKSKKKRDKVEDIQTISNTFLWVMSFIFGAITSHSLYFYMFYTQNYENKKILDGGVTMDKKIDEIHHGNRVNCLPLFASVNLFAKKIFCDPISHEDATDTDSQNQASNINSSMFSILKSLIFKIFKPFVSLIELFHNFLLVYIPNVINGEHGFLGKDFISFIPNIGTIFKNLKLSFNGSKFLILLLMSTLFFYHSGSDFMRYIIGTLSGTPKANGFTMFIYLLISLVAFGLIYDSFKGISKETGITYLKEQLVGENLSGNVAKTISSTTIDIIDKLKKRNNSSRVVPLNGGGNDDSGSVDGVTTKVSKCDDISEHQSIFIKSLMGLENAHPILGIVALPILFVLNLIIFLTILMLLFGLGPIFILLYLLGIISYTTFNSNLFQIIKNNKIMLQLDIDDKIDLSVKNVNSKDIKAYLNLNKTYLTTKNVKPEDIEAYLNKAPVYLDKINSISHKIKQFLINNILSLFIAISLFGITYDSYSNIKQENVRIIFSIMSGAIGVIILAITVMRHKNNNHITVDGLTNDNYGKNFFENYTTDNITGLSDDDKKVAIINIYKQVINNKFGDFKQLANNIFDFNKNEYAKQTKYNK